MGIYEPGRGTGSKIPPCRDFEPKTPGPSKKTLLQKALRGVCGLDPDPEPLGIHPPRTGCGVRLRVPRPVPSAARAGRYRPPSRHLHLGLRACPEVMMRTVWGPCLVPPALPDRSKSPPRSPPSACRLISKPIPYSPPCLRENWMLPRRDRLHIISLILPWVEPPRPIVVRVDEVGRAREVAEGELVVDPGAHTQRVRPVDPLLLQPVAGVGAGQ